MQVIVLAHEAGHHHHGHVGNSPRQELLADMHAAKLLIDPDDYARAGRLCGPRAGLLAQELDVSVAIIQAWQANCERRTA